MAAVIPGGRTPAGLADVLDRLGGVIDAQAHPESEDDVEHDGAWVEAMLDGATVPPDVCTEIGRSDYAISSAMCQGYENCVVELVPDRSGGGR